MCTMILYYTGCIHLRLTDLFWLRSKADLETLLLHHLVLMCGSRDKRRRGLCVRRRECAQNVRAGDFTSKKYLTQVNIFFRLTIAL